MHSSLNAASVVMSISLLVSACSSHGAGGDPAADTPKPNATAPVAGSSKTIPVGKPANPPQFKVIPEAEWDITKPIVGAEIKCENGKIRVFDCQAVNLLAFLPSDSIGGGFTNDIWGWTDSATGREFALIGRAAGTSFLEITDPVNPRYLGELPMTEGSKANSWRDIKVYKNHAFVVAEHAKHGLQIFDLTQLRNVASPPVKFQETAHYSNVASVHNIAINEATGFAYPIGSGGGGETCGGGLHMIDIRNPANPTFAGCYPETLAGSRTRGYIHDTQCTIYKGPDTQYQGRELCFNSAEKALGIVDVTDKQQPKKISVAEYPNAAYTHQGWLSDDHRYFFLGDEADEGKVKNAAGERRTRTLVFDLVDLDAPVMLPEFFGNTPAIDHNMYVRGRYIYQSNYEAGLRILDNSDPRALKEVGFWHSPKGSSWSNYPYFTINKDVVVFTSGTQGMFVVRHVPNAK